MEKSISSRRTRAIPKAPPGRRLRTGPSKVKSNHPDQQRVPSRTTRRRLNNKAAARRIHGSSEIPKTEFHPRKPSQVARSAEASLVVETVHRTVPVERNIRVCGKRRSKQRLRRE